MVVKSSMVNSPDIDGVPAASSAPAVDVTLIDEMLQLTPRQRLEQNDRMAALAAKLQSAFQSASGKVSDGWSNPAS